MAAYSLVQDINFSSSFSDSSIIDESDPFDPTDLDGIDFEALGRVRENRISFPSSLKLTTSSASPLIAKSPSKTGNECKLHINTEIEREPVDIEKEQKPTNIPDLSRTNPDSVAFATPLTTKRVLNSSPFQNNTVGSPKKLKFEAQNVRNFSTTLNFHTIELNTQRPEGPHDLTSTKQLKRVKPIVLSAEQEYVLQLAKKGQSIFFTGSAGTGKSVLLKSIIKGLKKMYRPEEVAVTASTGLASCNIGGITLHSFAGIGLGRGNDGELFKHVKKNKRAKKRWKNLKVLIIDEVSMIDGELFSKLDYIAKNIRNSSEPFGGIQLIACGDFYQLPPVPQDIGGIKQFSFIFESLAWRTAIKSSIILKEVFRQKGDQTFIDMLNELRTGIVSNETEREFKRLSRPLQCQAGIVPTELYATRNEVHYANETKLKAIREQEVLFDSIDSALNQNLLNNFLAPQELRLKKSAQVMCVKNFDDTLVNGSLGQVIDFLNKETYMCQQILDRDGDINELKNLIGEEDKGNDSIFSFLEECDDDEVYQLNYERKKELMEKLSKSSGDKLPLVRFLLPDGVNTRDVLVERETWQIEDENTKEIIASRNQVPLMLAWALSIHKSQGQTLPKAKVDLSRSFENGQAYVALSRAVSRDGLQVLNFSKEKVTTNAKVKEFYKNLKTSEELCKIPDSNQAAPSSFMNLTSKHSVINM